MKRASTLTSLLTALTWARNISRRAEDPPSPRDQARRRNAVALDVPAARDDDAAVRLAPRNAPHMRKRRRKLVHLPVRSTAPSGGHHSLVAGGWLRAETMRSRDGRCAFCCHEIKWRPHRDGKVDPLALSTAAPPCDSHNGVASRRSGRSRRASCSARKVYRRQVARREAREDRRDSRSARRRDR